MENLVCLYIYRIPLVSLWNIQCITCICSRLLVRKEIVLRWVTFTTDCSKSANHSWGVMSIHLCLYVKTPCSMYSLSWMFICLKHENFIKVYETKKVMNKIRIFFKRNINCKRKLYTFSYQIYFLGGMDLYCHLLYSCIFSIGIVYFIYTKRKIILNAKVLTLPTSSQYFRR